MLQTQYHSQKRLTNGLTPRWVTPLPRYRGADAFVLASHGEGWGRPALEAMAMGLPSIVTNWSGPTEFINEKVALPLPVTKLEPCTLPDATAE